MKRIRRSMLVFLAICALAVPVAALATAGASGDAPAESNGYVDPKTPAPTAKPTAHPSPTKKPTSKWVKLNKSGTVDLNLGSTLQLKATTSPSSAKKSLTWSSSDESVATVDQKGKVTAVDWGVATITAKAKNGKKASVKVNACIMAKKNGVTAKLDKKGVLIISGTGSVDRSIIWGSKKSLKSRLGGGKKGTNYLREEVKEVIIQKGITSIKDESCEENGLFYKMYGIEKVTIADSVKKIGDCAFCLCSEIKEVRWPKKLKIIGRYAFFGCHSLREIKVPASVREIREYAFSFNDGLKQIKLSEGLKTIGSCVFVDCDELKSLTIPRSVNKIGSGSDDDEFNIFDDMDGGATSQKTICGYKGSAAEKYAKKCKIRFKAIG